MLLATATATAALAIAPGAYAASAGDWGNDDSSYSKEQDKDSSHDKPNGGMHTGGGALTTVRGDDWSKDDSGSGSGKDDSGSGKDDSGSGYGNDDSGSGKDDSGSGYGNDDSGSGKDDSGSDHGKPSGGIHTGGGALATIKSGDDFDKDDKKFDPETYKDSSGSGSGKDDSGSGSGKDDSGYDSGSGKDDSGSGYGNDDSDSGYGKPSGGIHTGGGALSAPGMTAGGLAVLAVGAAGAYALRRRNAEGGVS
jgi:hypothetical protein